MRRLEGVKLYPIVDTDGVHWFHENEVDELLSEIANTGRALPVGAANEALQHARKEKRELVEDLECAQLTISALRGQVLVLHESLLKARYGREVTSLPNARIIAELREDIEYLFRHIDRPSFQTELVVTRVQTALRTL